MDECMRIRVKALGPRPYYAGGTFASPMYPRRGVVSTGPWLPGYSISSFLSSQRCVSSFQKNQSFRVVAAGVRCLHYPTAYM